MNTPPYGTLINIGNSSHINSILSFFINNVDICNWFLFNEYPSCELFNHIKKLYEYQVKFPYTIRPETLTRYCTENGLIDDLGEIDASETLMRMIEILMKECSKQTEIETKYNRNVHKYCNTLVKLRNAISENQPKSTISYLQNEYLSLREEFKVEILHTSALCCWNKMIKEQYYPLQNIMYGQICRTIKCEVCSYQNHEFRNFSVLCLKKKSSLEESFQQFTEIQKLKHVCSMCQGTETSCQDLLWKIPETLLISFRSQSDFNSNPYEEFTLNEVYLPFVE
jgi:ubiquitin C-terminal hydrolase